MEVNIDKVKRILDNIVGGKIQGVDAKVEMITYYNELNKTGYRTNTSCSSCLATTHRFFKKQYEIHKQ